MICKGFSFDQIKQTILEEENLREPLSESYNNVQGKYYGVNNQAKDWTEIMMPQTFM